MHCLIMAQRQRLDYINGRAKRGKKKRNCGRTGRERRKKMHIFELRLIPFYFTKTLKINYENIVKTNDTNENQTDETIDNGNNDYDNYDSNDANDYDDDNYDNDTSNPNDPNNANSYNDNNETNGKNNTKTDDNKNGYVNDDNNKNIIQFKFLYFHFLAEHCRYNILWYCVRIVPG